MKALALLSCFTSLASFAMVSHAQTGTYTWQVSNDNGATWSSSCNGTDIKVRLRAGWSGVNGTDEGFAGGQFDATIMGALPIDVISNIVRPAPFAFSGLYVASVIPGGQKIDHPNDVALPGLGTGWINPGQAARDFAAPGAYNSINGAIIFQFDLLCTEARPVVFSMVLNSVVGRAMAIYNNSAGAQTRISAAQVTVIPAVINIPTPTSLVLLCGCGLAATKRRRNEVTP